MRIPLYNEFVSGFDIMKLLVVEDEKKLAEYLRKGLTGEGYTVTPVLMLTAVAGVDDRVKGLKSGADDYLVKPFAFSELVARLGVITRRQTSAHKDGAEVTKLTLADLEVDLVRRKASRAGEALVLTAKEFSLLTLLLRRQGAVLSRTVIAEQVWDMNFDSGTNVVEVAIRRLRTKLDVPFEHSLLHTERGMGYVLEDRSTQ